MLLRNLEEFEIPYEETIMGFSDSLLASRYLYRNTLVPVLKVVRQNIVFFVFFGETLPIFHNGFFCLFFYNGDRAGLVYCSREKGQLLFIEPWVRVHFRRLG